MLPKRTSHWQLHHKQWYPPLHMNCRRLVCTTSIPPVTTWIELPLPSQFRESDTRFCGTVYVRFHVRREGRLQLTTRIDGNISRLLISNGKCTREDDHGDGPAFHTLLQGY
jgi:hypothetical protein